jgi:hypothetical protein
MENGPPKFIDFDDCSVQDVTDEESKKEIRLLVGIIKRYIWITLYTQFKASIL